MDGLIGELNDRGIELRSYKTGVDHRTICPQCQGGRSKEKSLSVRLDDDEQGAAWHCKRATCGYTDFIGTKRERRRLKPKAEPIKPNYVPEGNVPEHVYKWFAERGISRQTVDRYEIDYTEHWFTQTQSVNSCIAFPYRLNGEIVNVKYRDGRKNFMQEKGAEKILYGMDDCTEDWCIIVEGEVDKLAYAEIGVSQAVSVPDGAPKQVSEQQPSLEEDRKFEYIWNCKDFLDRMKKVIIATDGDGPGRALAEELARRIGKEKCWRIHWPEGRKDAGEVLKHLGAEELRRLLDAAEQWPIAGLKRVSDYREQIYEIYEGRVSNGDYVGMGPDIDDLFRLTPGLLVVVTGIPSSGKSNWLDQLVLNMAEEYGDITGFCSFENPPRFHALRLASKRARLPWKDGPTEKMTPDELNNALEFIDRHCVFIRDEDEPRTIDWILEQARIAVMRWGIKYLVIDPYNEIEHHRTADQREDLYISQMLMKVKRFCAYHGVTCFFVAHPTKLRKRDDGSVPIPNLYDISGGANWRNKADFGITIHRDDYERPPQSHIIVNKVKWEWLGRHGQAVMFYDPATTRYSDNASDFRGDNPPNEAPPWE